MRALIRVTLHPAAKFSALWGDLPAYQREVITLFREIGYAAEVTAHPAEIALSDPQSEPITPFDINASWKEVQDIFKDSPEDVKLREMQHLVMLGYSSEGQGVFVVCAINPSVLHIRFRQSLFQRLRLNSEGICQSILEHRRTQFRGIVSKWFRSIISKNRQTQVYLTVKPDIDVFEPDRDNVTIVGHIVESATREMLKIYYGEIGIAVLLISA